VSPDISEHLLRDAIDLKLNVQRKLHTVFDTVLRKKLMIVDRLRKQEFQRRHEPDIFQYRGT
jgi:hypothetical protein